MNTIIIYTNMDVILFRTFSHVITMTQKVVPHTGAGTFIRESSTKVIGAGQDSGKGQLIKSIE